MAYMYKLETWVDDAVCSYGGRLERLVVCALNVATHSGLISSSLPQHFITTYSQQRLSHNNPLNPT